MKSFKIVKNYADTNGRVWHIGINTKTIHGRVELSEMAIWANGHGYPLNRKILRDLSMDTLLKDVVAGETESLTQFHKHQKELKPHQGRAHSDDELRVIAKIYMTAFNGRISVQRAVAKTFNTSISTAAHRISVARKRGFIPKEANKQIRHGK